MVKELVIFDRGEDEIPGVWKRDGDNGNDEVWEKDDEEPSEAEKENTRDADSVEREGGKTDEELDEERHGK